MVLILAFLVLIEIMCFQIDKKSPLSIFSIIWIVILFLYQLKLYNIYSIDEKTVIIIGLGILLFVLGYIVSATLNEHFRIKQFWPDPNQQAIYIENTGFIRLLTIVTIAASLPQTIQRIRYFSFVNFSTQLLKNSLITGELSSGSLLQVVWVNPISAIIIVIATYYMLNGIKDALIYLGAIYFILVGFVLSGSKFTFIYLVVGLLVNISNSGKFNFDFKKLNKKIKALIFAIIAFLLIYIYTYKGGAIYQQLYYYACGCLTMLDKVVTKNSYFTGMTTCFGALSFYPIYNIISKILNIFGFSTLDSCVSQAEDYLAAFEKSNYAGSGIQFNAFSTFVSYPYIDFGIVGMCIVCFLYGFLINRLYVHYKNNQSLSNVVVISFVYLFMITSMVRFQFSNYSMCLGLIYMFIFGRLFTKKFYIDS